MSYSLVSLEKASGYAASAGQDFVSNVLPTGAKPNAKMTDYFINNWDFSGEPPPETTYNDNSTFNVTIAFAQGAYASYIKRAGTGLISFSNSYGPDYTGTLPQHNDGFQIASSSSTVNGDTTGSFSITLRAPMAPASGFAGSAWFANYTSPNEPTYNGADPDPVKFTGSIQPGSGGGTSMLQCFSIAYTPDNGPFNPPMNKTFPINMYVRSTDTSTIGYDWEWYSDSGYQTLYHTGVGFTVFSYPGNTFTYYLRARKTGDPFWTNVGAVTFYDDRPAV